MISGEKLAVTDREGTKAPSQAGEVAAGSDADSAALVSQACFRQIFERTGAGLAVLDSEGFLLEVNPAACRMIGFSAEELVGRHWKELTHPDDVEYSHVAREKGLSVPGNEFTMEKRYVRADGSVLWAEVRGSWMLDQDGSPAGTVVSILDITDRKEREAIAERYRAVYEESNIGIAVAGADGRLVSANRAYEEFIGYSQEELITKSWRELTHPDDVAQQDRYWEGLRSGKSAKACFEKRYIRRDGSVVWGSLHMTTITEPGSPQLTIAIVEDITQHKQAEAALSANEKRYRRLVDGAQEGIWFSDENDVTTFVNSAMAGMLGYEPSDMVGRSIFDFIPEELHTLGREQLEARRKTRKGERLQAYYRHRDGHTVWTILSASPIFSDDDRYLGSLAMVLDVTEQRVRDEQLRLQADLLEAVGQAVIFTDVQGTIKYWNKAAENLYGWSAEEALGQKESDLIVPPSSQKDGMAALDQVREGKSWSGEFLVRRRDGETFPALVNLVCVFDEQGEPIGIIGTSTDVTVQKQYEEQLRYQALHDSLTDLPNRTLFLDHVDMALRMSRRASERFSILYLDLDSFKDINDALGHTTGDWFLQAVAKRLQSQLRESDTVARFGGDEFAVLLPGADQVGAIRAANKLLEGLNAPIYIEGRPLYARASIGIVTFPQHGIDATTLMKRVDVAMYAAKRLHANYSVYHSTSDEHSALRLELAHGLSEAIASNELFLDYQPILDLRTSEVIEVEGLLRWRHAGYGLIEPDHFIGIAEEKGLVKPLTEWVVNEAARQVSVWSRQGIDVKIAVNLSAANLHNGHLLSTLERAAGRWKVEPSRLRFEITEHALMTDAEGSMRTMAALNELGVGVSIDDFGKGYSSLGYLQKLHLDALKIDREFVLHMTKSASNSNAIVRMVIDLAHTLGWKVVAEGIQSQEQLDMLIALKCDHGQGFLFSRPVNPARLERWLKDWSERGEKRLVS